MSQIKPAFKNGTPLELNEAQASTLKSILNTYLSPLTQQKEDELVKKFEKTHSEHEIRHFCRISAESLNIYQDALDFINCTAMPDKRQELAMVLSFLSTKTGSLALTGHFTEFSRLSHADREKAILSWKNSSIAPIRLLYKSFHALACFPSYSWYLKEMGSAIKYDDSPESLQQEFPPRFEFLQQVPEGSTYDVIVIGSGAGGGVVASELSKAGKSVLVIEKGDYYHESEFIHNSAIATRNLYEQGGIIATRNSSVSMLAGSVFGGGTTVNWCASLKPQHFVREQWAKEGLAYFMSPKFSKDLDRVYERIGATTEGIVHNGSNQILIDGCKALGYPYGEIPQNSGGKPHTCNYCYAGCRAGVKNGTMNTWLRDAAKHGAQFLTQTVERVLIHQGQATGVQLKSGQKIHARQVVVSAGSLHSPGILTQSGLKNKNIGKHLKLHPCSIIFGTFDKPIRAYEGTIMTAVSGVVDNLKDEGYGAKLEVPSLPPSSYCSMAPWMGAEDHKEFVLKYERTSPIISLIRDKDSVGSVKYDKNGSLLIEYELSKRDRQSLMAGIEKAVNVLVAAGAREVRTGQFGVPPFVFKPEEESSIINPRFVRWRKQVLDYGFPNDGAGVFCAHQMGTNRMGVSPKISVVQPTGETWEVKNLFVADASVFPTASGVNPMVTIEATCLHIADCIIQKDARAKL